MRRWLAGFVAATALVTGGLSARPDDGFKALFDGKSIEGWKREGGEAEYRVEDGCIVGKTVDGSPNTFLCKGPYGDFILEFEVKCDPKLNSGCQIRSHVYEEATNDAKGKKRKQGTLYGYQCEIAAAETGTSGNFWDEARRNKWLGDFKDRPEAKSAFKNNEWNRYRIVAQGNRIRSWVNGVACADFTDDTDKEGLIGLQVHSIGKGEGPYEVRWRNIRIKELKAGDTVD
jgi:hypothetical protein